MAKLCDFCDTFHQLLIDLAQNQRLQYDCHRHTISSLFESIGYHLFISIGSFKSLAKVIQSISLRIFVSHHSIMNSNVCIRWSPHTCFPTRIYFHLISFSLSPQSHLLFLNTLLTVISDLSLSLYLQFVWFLCLLWYLKC
jgi:hypothetical protein